MLEDRIPLGDALGGVLVALMGIFPDDSLADAATVSPEHSPLTASVWDTTSEPSQNLSNLSLLDSTANKSNAGKVSQQLAETERSHLTFSTGVPSGARTGTGHGQWPDFVDGALAGDPLDFTAELPAFLAARTQPSGLSPFEFAGNQVREEGPAEPGSVGFPSPADVFSEQEFGDDAALLSRAGGAGPSLTTGTPVILPAPAAASAPPTPVIPPRPRTTGPSVPARPPGTLVFGGGAVGSAGGGGGGGAGGASCGWATYGEATVFGTTVSLGVEGRLEGDNQAVDVHGASMLLPAAGQYTIYFDVDLSTWDAYTEDPKAMLTDYWDSFSVSVTPEPYPYLAWSDPVSLPFWWGGQAYGDGEPDTLADAFTITVKGNPEGGNYLNVVLDTFSQPDADVRYPSWGTVIIARVTADGTNFPPVAVDDAYTVLHDTTLIADGSEELDVLFNDCNLDGDPLTAQVVDPPAVGDLSFNPDGTFTYTPPPLFTGQVTFTYLANDGTADSNPATVIIDVINDAPVARDDTYDLEPNISLTETTPGVLGNDYDPDGDSKTAAFEPGYGPYNGTLDYFDPDGSFMYTPKPDFVGTDSFAYRVFDGITYSLVGLVTLVVSAEERVTFPNKSRGGDEVVSARFLASGMPGGIKTLEVQAIPANAVVTLTVGPRVGTGSAVFQDTQTNTKQLMGAADGRYTVTIQGGSVSSQAKNMRIEARINNVVRGVWDFTVFEVVINTYTTGKVAAVVPDSVQNFASQALRTEVLKNTLFRGDLGHTHVDERVAWGAIVIRGRIQPSGMDPLDFNQEHSRTESFNWDRKRSGRQYDGNGCIKTNVDAIFAAADDHSDDRNDEDEDLNPGNDGQPNELYIWAVDGPNAVPKEVPNNGDIQRIRNEFAEYAQYAGVKVSSTLNWYWRSSQENPAGPADFAQNNAVAGDNRLQSFNTTLLTPNLGPSTIPNFTVTGSAPATANRGEGNVNATIDGTLLNSGAPCQPLVYWIRETPGVRGLTRTVIPLTITNVTATRITGTFNVPANAQLGTYALKAFIGDKAQTLPNALTINAP